MALISLKFKQDINTDTPAIKVDADLDVNNVGGDADINAPKVGTSVDVNVPKVGGDIDINAPKVGGDIDINAPKVDGDLDINAPKVGGDIDINAPKVDGDLDINAPKVDGDLDINAPKVDGDLDINATGGLSRDKPQRSASFLDKVGAFFKKGGRSSTSSDSDTEPKRGKKRKRTKDADVNLNTPGIGLEGDINVDVDASTKPVEAGINGDFEIIDTPSTPKKTGDINASLDAQEKIDVDVDGSLKPPKSPSFFTRLGMFFRVHSNEYDLGKKKPKKKRKLSWNSKHNKDKTKVQMDAETLDGSSQASVKRDDSFTIPEANATIIPPTIDSNIDTKVESNLGM